MVVKTRANVPNKNYIPPFSSPQKLKLNTNEIKQYIIQNLPFDSFLPFQLPSSLTKKIIKAPSAPSNFFMQLLMHFFFLCYHYFNGFFSLHFLNLIKISVSFCFQIISVALVPPGNITSLLGNYFLIKRSFPKNPEIFFVTIFGFVFHPKISVPERASMCAHRSRKKDFIFYISPSLFFCSSPSIKVFRLFFFCISCSIYLRTTYFLHVLFRLLKTYLLRREA